MCESDFEINLGTSEWRGLKQKVVGDTCVMTVFSMIFNE